MRRVLAATAITGIAIAIALTGSPASANPSTAAAPSMAAAMDDELKCGPTFTHPTAGDVQNCPDWSPTGSIPVHENTAPDSTVVGQINPSGDDWYVCQQVGDSDSVSGFTNNWWAFTMADNGSFGWVNEVYFRGGEDNEHDFGLAFCPGGATGP